MSICEGTQTSRSEIEHVPTDWSCPSCGGMVHHAYWAQDAMFFHGGHGETARFHLRQCVRCPWSLGPDVEAARPPRRREHSCRLPAGRTP
jgi:hypothetical protein